MNTPQSVVLVVAVALVDPDGRVLIAQRPEGKSMAGLWEFPGGKVEAGETPGKTNDGSYANGHPSNKVDGTHFKEAMAKQYARMVVTEFARLFYTEKDVKQAFDRYVVPDYIQHNPNLPDGRAAAVAMLAPMFSAPGAEFDVKRIIVDGNMAVIHLFGRGDPKTQGAAVTDIFRLKDGKIVEHWDVLQPMPATAANRHPMF